jgi:hypothetical protein
VGGANVALDLGLLFLALLVRHCSSFEVFASVVTLSSFQTALKERIFPPTLQIRNRA